MKTYEIFTILIALAGAYIAYQQYIMTRARYRLDRYERAISLYSATTEFLHKVMRKGNAEYDQISAYRLATSQAYFILGHDIGSYIDDIVQRATALATNSSMYRDAVENGPSGYDHRAIVEGKHSNLKWLCDQLEANRVRDRFKPQLDVSDSALVGF